MQGPHSLTESNVARRVENQPGVYKLYNTRDGPVRYISHSNHIAGRLRSFVGDYNFFEYEHPFNKTEAYKRAVQLYHYHGAKRNLDNTIHPPRPHKRVTCPRCSLHE